MIALITINDNNNIGNRLQNYAAFQLLKKYDTTFNIVRKYGCEYKHFPESDNSLKAFLRPIYYNFLEILHPKKYCLKLKRAKNFTRFNRLIANGETLKYNFDYNKINDKYQYFFVGSDQVWNPNLVGNGMFINMLGFCNDSRKKCSLAASISVDQLTDEQKEIFTRYLSDFSHISCREKNGSEMIESLINKKVVTLLDPTLMLDADDWKRIAKKPRFHKGNSPFVLLYFLGNITNDYENAIKQYSLKYNLRIVNILDYANKYYCCGPSEFLWLLMNSSLVLTDSFHGCVFSFLFDKPFKIFTRVSKGQSMNSRITNLAYTLKLPDSVFFDPCDDKTIDFKIHYDKTSLTNERNKFKGFLDGVFEQDAHE